MKKGVFQIYTKVKYENEREYLRLLESDGKREPSAYNIYIAKIAFTKLCWQNSCLNHLKISRNGNKQTKTHVFFLDYINSRWKCVFACICIRMCELMQVQVNGRQTIENIRKKQKCDELSH